MLMRLWRQKWEYFNRYYEKFYGSFLSHFFYVKTKEIEESECSENVCHKLSTTVSCLFIC